MTVVVMKWSHFFHSAQNFFFTFLLFSGGEDGSVNMFVLAFVSFSLLSTKSYKNYRRPDLCSSRNAMRSPEAKL